MSKYDFLTIIVIVDYHKASHPVVQRWAEDAKMELRDILGRGRMTAGTSGGVGTPVDNQRREEIKVLDPEWERKADQSLISNCRIRNNQGEFIFVEIFYITTMLLFSQVLADSWRGGAVRRHWGTIRVSFTLIPVNVVWL